MRNCLKQKISSKGKASPAYQVAQNPDEKLSIKLNFLQKPRTQRRAQFTLNEHMISVLKSEINPKGAATMVGRGISFKKLSKIIGAGGKMKHFNRIMENNKMPSEDTMEMIKNCDDVKSVGSALSKVAKMGNAKVLFHLLKNHEDPISLGQGIQVLNGLTLRKAKS